MNDKITQKLDEMQARCVAATEGPWEHLNPRNTYNHAVVDNHGEDLANDYEGVWYSEEDADFIAASRTDMPSLIAALRAVIDTHTSRWGECAWCVNGSGQNCKYPCPTVKAVEEALGVES